MPQPIHNPFYVVLLAACAALLITMFVCVTMWVRPQDQAPPWVLWIDRHWMKLIVGEVAAILVLAGLTIGLDRFFEKPAKNEDVAKSQAGQEENNA